MFYKKAKTFIHQWINPLIFLNVTMLIVIFINRQEFSLLAKMVVMYIEKVPPTAVLRLDCYREGNQVKKRTLAKLSKLPDDIILSTI